MSASAPRQPAVSTTFVSLLVLLSAGLTGCSRSHYRRQADCQVDCLVARESAGTPWALPGTFTIEPDPRSRLFDPTDPTDPALPPAGPDLYAYRLPTMAETGPEAIDAPPPESLPAGDSLPRPSRADAQPATQLASATAKLVPQLEIPAPGGTAELPAPRVETDPALAGLPLLAVRDPYWQAVPPKCLRRMLEFTSVRMEYRRQYGADPPAALRDDSQRLSLVEIVQIALLNSREYQRQKEDLYLAALAVTLEQYDYLTKFSTRGNAFDLGYTHSRSDGTTVNTLGRAFGLQADKTLATGGNLLARFANDVVFTFNGPQGFTADVSSELFFDITQTLFQHDVLLNPLIQSERNLVYAAREFARFRQEFFFDRASEYYALLSAYRRIEINAQDYFSQVRNLEQGRAELRAGIQTAPNQVEVDQFEQGMLSGRRTLISSCNNLERALDELKISMGLPTETRMNLDLTELERLTLRDESEVAGERVRRWQIRLQTALAKQPSDRGEIINAVVFLLERVLEWLRLREQLQKEVPPLEPLVKLRARLRTDEARLNVDLAQRELQRSRQSVPPAPPIQQFHATMDVLDTLLVLFARQVELAGELRVAREEMTAAVRHSAELKHRAEQLRQRRSAALLESDARQLAGLLKGAEQLLADAESLVRSADRLTGAPAERPSAEAELRAAMDQAGRFLGTTQSLLKEAELGLQPVNTSVDAAMVTALVQRVDLMNERGLLADAWRDIKYTADDLRSVLDLDASQSIRTQNNRPLDFSFRNSTTRLALAVDLPLNRLAQRNAFRRSLITYQQRRRELMAYEDQIKLAVRNELRDLELTRVQYPINVASAALAAEQVISIRLSLALGVANVRGTDLLDALADSRNSLIGVANDRIAYIVGRARFALDLGVMQLDGSGFWPDIADDEYQPKPDLTYPVGAGPTYGDIPRWLKVSPEILRMYDVGPPGKGISDDERPTTWQRPEPRRLPDVGAGVRDLKTAGAPTGEPVHDHGNVDAAAYRPLEPASERLEVGAATPQRLLVRLPAVAGAGPANAVGSTRAVGSRSAGWQGDKGADGSEHTQRE